MPPRLLLSVCMSAAVALAAMPTQARTPKLSLVEQAQSCDGGVACPYFPEVYKAEALTLGAAYTAIKEAPVELDWTMLAPAPEIQPGERTGKYSTAKDTPAGSSISTQDYAVAMLDEIERPAYRRARFTAAN